MLEPWAEISQRLRRKFQTASLSDYTDSVLIRPFRANLWPMFNPQPLHYRPLESRANLFAD